MGQTHTHACTHIALAHTYTHTNERTNKRTHADIIYMCAGITSEKSKCTRDPNPFLWLLIKLRICQWIEIHGPRQFIMMHIVSCCQFTEKLFRIKPIKVNVTADEKKNKIQIHTHSLTQSLIRLLAHTSHVLIIMVLARPYAYY